MTALVLTLADVNDALGWLQQHWWAPVLGLAVVVGIWFAGRDSR